MSAWTLWRWRKRYRAGGPKGLEDERRGRPKGSGTLPGLAEPIRAAIVETKRRFPHFGLRRVRDFLRRFEALGVSVGSVRKVFRAEDLPPAVPPRRRKPKRVRVVRRFERARPRELWQSDITVLSLARQRERAYLVVFLDDASR